MKKIALLLAAAVLLSCSGCSKKIELPKTSSAPAVVQKGEMNPLTGEYGFKKSAVGTRPYAVMVSNIKIALPQHGIGSADICYEALAEGGITRIMAVFADRGNVKKTGPVRSVRDYYVDLAEGLDAILVHFGGSPKGYQVIKDYGTDDIDGMTSSAAFAQDASLAAQKGREHSFFTDSKRLNAVLKQKKYKTGRKPYSAFKFAAEGASADMPEAAAATDVTVPFSGYCRAEFKYDKKSKKYLKGEFEEKQIDNNSKKQVSVKNVFVLKTSVTPVAGDRHGRIAVDLTSGKGVYLTDGKMINIKWKKGAHGEMLKYYTADGKELSVNRGKSWVCIIPDTNSVEVNAPARKNAGKNA